MNIGPKLAALNAVLNGMAFLLLFAGWRAVRARRMTTHKRLMGSAFAVSCVFLISYLLRVYLTGTHRYPGEGFLKTLYLVILGSHTLLAATVPFLAVRTIYLALKGRIDSHRRIARWTLPIWMYVSLTGVVVYLMLYQFP
jgi:putative membrane protein